MCGNGVVKFTEDVIVFEEEEGGRIEDGNSFGVSFCFSGG